MIKVYHVSLTRSVRVVWLLEELALPYALEGVELEPPAPRPFAQRTPSGKVPTIEDDGMTMFESGAILEYVLEKYGEGRLAPAVGSPLRGPFLQWVHFGEATAMTGLGNIAWHTRFKGEDVNAEFLSDYRNWTEAAFDTLERHLSDAPYLLGSEFSAADIMVGYTLLVARSFGVLTKTHAAVDGYLDRLTERPALRAALAA